MSFPLFSSSPPDVTDVFGVSSKQVLSYAEREGVDSAFRDALRRSSHVVVYGASKQGKTSLVRRHLAEDNYILVSASPKMETKDMYRMILRKAGVKVEVSSSSSLDRTSGLSGVGKFGTSIPFVVKGEGEIAARIDHTTTTEKQFEQQFNIELPADVSDLLKTSNCRKLIVIENFHYLTETRQRELAFDLRTFHDLGIQFIILGVWCEKNRLAQYNGDLQDRITEITVEPWQEQHLKVVAEVGAQILGIVFADDLIRSCIQSAVGSVAVFQELLKELCLNAQRENLDLHLARNFRSAVEKKVQDYKGRLLRSLEMFARDVKTNNTLFGSIPFAIVRVLLLSDFERCARGIPKSALLRDLRAKAKEIEQTDDASICACLNVLSELQANANITPPIIDYDGESQTLRIIDLTLLFLMKHDQARGLLTLIQ